MQATLMIIHFLVCLSLIVLVLMQHGRGADAGVAFGSGNASSVFGAQGSTSFLIKLTTICAVLFFVTTLALGLKESQISHQFANLVKLNDSQTEQAEVVE